MTIRILGLAFGLFAVLTSSAAVAGSLISVAPAETTTPAPFAAALQLGWPLAIWLPVSASAACIVCATSRPRPPRVGLVIAVSLPALVAIAVTATAIAIYLRAVFG